MDIQKLNRGVLLTFALVAFFGPNGLYLFMLITQPELNAQAFENPISLAFIIEAFMLLFLFLGYVYKKNKSVSQVIFYFLMACVGSLAFSFPLFCYNESKKQEA